MAEMKFKFTIQEYQTEAVDSVVKVFAGQLFQNRTSYRRDVGENEQGTFTISGTDISYSASDEIGFANAPVSIDSHQLLKNIREVQKNNNLHESAALAKHMGACSLDVEMETGTGKTFASAFAMREENQKRVLFLVHREQIAKQAMASYRRVFGNTRTFGLLSGNSKEYDADYLFSTMQMMSKEEVLAHFRPDSFQTIIVDETHRIGSPSYQKILKYFHPGFWLGMSATPERSDGYDVYALFDHNIAYEIRLQQAMEENLLCPFHYFGITDITIDGETAGDDPASGGSMFSLSPSSGRNGGNEKQKELRQFNFLTSDARVEYIMEKAAYYGHSGDRVKGLMFVSRREVGEELSRKFNAKGLKTVFLSGETSQEKREGARHYGTSLRQEK